MQATRSPTAKGLGLAGLPDADTGTLRCRPPSPCPGPTQDSGYGSPLATKPLSPHTRRTERVQTLLEGSLRFAAQRPGWSGQQPEETSPSASLAWPAAARFHGGTVSLAVKRRSSSHSVPNTVPFDAQGKEPSG